MGSEMKAILALKGPSAHAASDVISDLKPDIIATVNDAIYLLDKDTAVDYSFFTHWASSSEDRRLHPHASCRIKTFVTPELSATFPHNDWVKSEGHKWIRYEHHTCDGDPAALSARIFCGGITHHHTASAAVHWLCKNLSLDSLYVIGLDGGDLSNYATGVKPACHKDTMPGDVLDVFRRVMLDLIPILNRVYGTDIKVIT